MATTLTLTATESGSYIVTASFTNENGLAMTPTSITWTLKDADGAVVNSRSAVPVTPAASIEILLSGNDLPASTPLAELTLTLNVVYTSLTHGPNIPLVAQVKIPVEGLS